MLSLETFLDFNLTPLSPFSWVSESFRQDIGQFHLPWMKPCNLKSLFLLKIYYENSDRFPYNGGSRCGSAPGKKNRARLSSCSSIQKKREKKIPICMPQILLKLKYFIFYPLCKIVLLGFYWHAISQAFTRPKVAKKDGQDRVYNWRSIRQDHKSTTTNSRKLTSTARVSKAITSVIKQLRDLQYWALVSFSWSSRTRRGFQTV